jgi:hypothetical protein
LLEVTMKHPGFTIFLVFFGISLLDALWGGHWAIALFWIAMGLVFAAMDHVIRRRTGQAGNPIKHLERRE